MSATRSVLIVMMGFGVLDRAARLTDAASPRLGGEMKHLFITVDGFTSSVEVDMQGDPQERVQLLHYDETYAPPADVLDGTGYSGRYGWLAGGFIFLGPKEFLWVRLLHRTPGLLTFEEFTFDPILSASDPEWQWRG